MVRLVVLEPRTHKHRDYRRDSPRFPISARRRNVDCEGLSCPRRTTRLDRTTSRPYAARRPVHNLMRDSTRTALFLSRPGASPNWCSETHSPYTRVCEVVNKSALNAEWAIGRPAAGCIY
jgi:hypothetical protein